jgi:hypothetical protein
MKFRVSAFVCTVSFAAALASMAACGGSSSSPSGTSKTASVAAPQPVTPANAVSIQYASQPVTLTAQNAVATQSGGTMYKFEVAADSGFASIVQTKDGVAEGTNGQTSVKLDSLTGAKDYYWHVRATAGGTTGVFGNVFKFTVGPPITINTPAIIGPLTGATTSPRPALRVTNATRSSNAGTITYKFEVSSLNTFATLVASATVPEGINETGFIPTSDLPTGVTLYWRATALDAANGVSSTPTAVQSFVANPFSQAEALANQIGQVLWPGIVPPGTIGHATMGNDAFYGVGWAVQTLYYAPGNVTFQSPDIEMLRYFDLFDRGMDPDSAIAWMNSNGYPSAAVWYPPPDKAVLGLHYVYIAARGKVTTNGTWDIVLRVE